jgi:hypothetical protein
MTPEEPFAVVLFESVSHALQAEKIIKSQNITGKLIPVPRHLSSDCGVCLRINLSSKDPVKTILKGKMDFFEIAPL